MPHLWVCRSTPPSGFAAPTVGLDGVQEVQRECGDASATANLLPAAAPHVLSRGAITLRGTGLRAVGSAPSAEARCGPPAEEVLAAHGELHEVFAIQSDAAEAARTAPQQQPRPLLPESSAAMDGGGGLDAPFHGHGGVGPLRGFDGGVNLFGAGAAGNAAEVSQRDVRAQRVGLPPVDPQLSMTQQAADAVRCVRLC